MNIKMDDTDDQVPTAGSRLSAFDLVELQDQLLSAGTELDRLDQLIADAAGRLLEHFGRAKSLIDKSILPDTNALIEPIEQAMIALQFHDMSSQLISHVRQRVQSVSDFLGASLDDGDEAAPTNDFVNRSCPVAQREMDAGSVELF
jgi:hypothetical protein